ncbi:MAG: acyltransferase [Microbacterium sp.]|nr:acyltransferase [Microbacterium sp.]MBW8761705.1 acyltransferase [Microbacterium sp.]
MPKRGGELRGRREEDRSTISTITASRFAGLDGLRGLAAVIVVLYHTLLASTWGDAYQGALAEMPTSSATVNLIANTPLRYLVMGPEAVVVFFALSGFVLVLPMLQGRALDLWSYYPRRVLRLWIPSVAAMLLAAVVILSTTQRPDDAPSAWGRAFSFASLSPGEIVDSLFLITGSTKTNNPLWSLRWELLFSFMLPLAFLLVARVRRGAWGWLILCGVASGTGGLLGVQALTYGPMFLAGSLVATMAVRDARAGLARPWILIAGGLLLIGTPDALRVVTPFVLPDGIRGFSQGTVTVGAALLVLGLTRPSGATTLLSSRLFRFLGRISFSLYLVHVPLLIGAIHVAPFVPHRALLVVLPIVAIVAVLFTRWVEEPSARLARRAGRAASTRVRALVGQDR